MRVSMQRERGMGGAGTTAATVGAAAVAAAAMGGALVAFGVRAGDAVHHINALAGLVLGSRVTFVTGAHPVVTTLGVVMLLVGALLWGALFVRLAGALGAGPRGAVRHRRGGGVVVAACATAALAFCVDAFVLPRLAAETTLAALSLSRLVVVHLLLAASLPIGMRLALSGDHSMSDDALAAPRVYRSGDGG
jgi:hypothetical protein